EAREIFLVIGHLLRQAGPLGRIELRAVGARPLALEIGIAAVVPGACRQRRQEGRDQQEGAYRETADHADPPQRRSARQWLTTIGLPSMKNVSLAAQAPPGAPLRSGVTFALISSPDFSVLLDQPSRTSELALTPSRLHTASEPSLATTFSMMKACGLVNLKAVTVPASTTGLSASNMAKE